ncbi:MAG: DUF2520 domain-containing protein [Chloroflexota bacterium]
MGGRQGIGIVGGRAGTALALALVPGRLAAGRRVEPGPCASGGARGPPGGRHGHGPAARGVALASHLVILAVPDDATIRDVAAGLGARPGSVVAHLSGVHPAPCCGTGRWRRGRGGRVPSAGGVRGRGTGSRCAAWRVRRARRGPGGHRGRCGRWARPWAPDRWCWRVATARASAKAAHHAAVLAAGGFVALLDAMRGAWARRGPGRGDVELVEVYGSLVRQGLANAAALGVDAALTGPVPRGDVGTVAAHLEAIAASAPDVWTYVALGRRQLAIARRHDAPADEGDRRAGRPAGRLGRPAHSLMGRPPSCIGTIPGERAPGRACPRVPDAARVPSGDAARGGHPTRDRGALRASREPPARPAIGPAAALPVRSQQGRAMRAAAATQPVRSPAAARSAAGTAARRHVEPRPGGAGSHLLEPPRARLRDPRGAATPWRG